MNAIEAEHLGKSYRMMGSEPPTLLLSLTHWRRKRKILWALNDVSFAVKTGETVGIIGPNGSGKSSCLSLIAGTTSPTTGVVRTRGRISSLLELGAGFHSELTGRENIFLNGSILGISRRAIKERFDRIVDFAGVGEFLDMPVKFYSSGMYVRLGFAIAVETDPDILLVDEVLAVGDIAFQTKCFSRIREFQRMGKTILMVSHGLQTVEEFCDRVFLLHHGRLVAQGDPAEVIFAYLKSYMGEGGGIRAVEYGIRDAEIEQVRFLDSEGRESGTFETGKLMTVEIRYNARRRIEQPVFGFSVKTGNGMFVFGSNSQLAEYRIPAIEGKGSIKLFIEPLSLMQGNFFLSLSIHSWDHSIQYHRREDWYPFVVKNPSGTQGIFYLNSRWEMNEAR